MDWPIHEKSQIPQSVLLKKAVHGKKGCLMRPRVSVTGSIGTTSILNHIHSRNMQINRASSYHPDQTDSSF